MKKIYLSIIAIVLTVGLVSGAAYALFSDTVTISGLTVTTGNADLVIYDGGTTIPINDFVPTLNVALANLYPGWQDYTVMDFVNDSTSDIGLNLKAQLTSAGGDWDLLKDKIQIAINETGDSQNFPTTDWHTLAQWNTNEYSFGDILDKGETDTYKMFIRILNSVGNEIAGKGLTNVTFVVTGTQVSP